MIRSGETIDLGAALGRKVVDKHSTGGVGDKTSLSVGPIVAACGVPLGKMSGRGLGHTGGTLDKLESIPGFRTELTLDEFVAQVRDVGVAIIGQTGDLVPADKLLYGLRDVTATVDQLSLIAASIMSKKLAGGAQAIVLDVKVGDGAFMKTIESARELAETMIAIGENAGREVVCLLTDMDQPLGAAVGNALEVREALDTVRGHGPADFTELVLDACAKLLALSDLGIDEAEGRRRAEAAVADGSAEATWRRWIEAQGGTADESALPTAPVVHELVAPVAGYVDSLSAIDVGNAAVHLGAGRRIKEDQIDHSVGIVVRAKRGDRVEAGQTLAEVHARTEDEAARRRRARCSRRTRSRTSRPPRGRCCSRSSASGPRRDTSARYGETVPELPEVETVRRRLAPVLEGRRFEHVEINDPRLTRPDDPFEVARELEGERVTMVDRRGKYLIVRFESGRALLIHLRMTGSLRHAAEGKLQDDPHRRAVVTLDDGSDVAYRDVRRFGTWLLLEPSDVDAYIDTRVGKEPLDDAYKAKHLAEKLAHRRAPIKAAILDQRTVAGVGNIYADEALWRAQVHPLTPANALDAGRGEGGAQGHSRRVAGGRTPAGLDAARLPAA